MQRLILFLDDGGVMNDNRLRTPQWQRLLGEFFPPRLGGSAEGWAEANRVYTEGLWAVNESWLDYAAGLWRQGGETYAGFQRQYHIEWLHGMCKLLDLPLPPEDEAVAMSQQATHFVTRRVRAALRGVVDAIRSLKRAGYTLHTASGESSFELDGYLTGMGVRDCFDRLYGPDLVDRLKDGPDYYRRILADVRIDPSTAVFIDDSPIVVEWIRAAGAQAVLVGPAAQTDGHSDAWLTLDSLADLLGALSTPRGQSVGAPPQ